MYAVILAGGGGTRLWPLSRVARPKPFLALTGDETLLQATVARLQPLIDPADVYLVADGRYAGLVKEQLRVVPEANLVTEPVGRNTAAAVALAALSIERPSDDVMVVLPADHRITDVAGFRDALAAAAEVAADGSLVALGTEPDAPATGYGYILAQGKPRVVGGMPAFSVERFLEKPSEERARELIEGGRAHWNAGIFVWRRDALLEGLARYAPDILEALGGGLEGSDLGAAYAEVRATSIDYALLEPASLEGRVAVVPIAVGWSDLGSWAALLEALTADALAQGGSSVVGHAGDGATTIDIDSTDLLVHAAGGRLVATVGLEGLVVIDTPDALLVCAADRAQDVKRVVDRLAAEGQRDRL
ncbi:MAG: NTP transferase domain-containing protein [Chloroflexi bacterium]|nr:NTP transferase domain-containing protein [Chloroflexota bacterium]MBA3852052.1 NTP transferase domain-containing protein [Chloroflexota bacterium]MDQ3407224.1 sugar phosphate nucleotidyltransferase [Chloroflexota bacterium]